MLWDLWKKGFNAWEATTAEYMEKVLQNPLMLGTSGALLGAVMKTKAASDKAVAQAWGLVGLPTRRDQERTLHALNQIQSRLSDIEEKLAER
jgi:hypothetical protein